MMPLEESKTVQLGEAESRRVVALDGGRGETWGVAVQLVSSFSPAGWFRSRNLYNIVPAVYKVVLCT